jgi:hypothetical protein
MFKNIVVNKKLVAKEPQIYEGLPREQFVEFKV